MKGVFYYSRGSSEFAECLDPNDYVASQALGHSLLNSGSSGIVYPSVRKPGGVCIVCFRPPLVLNVRKGAMVTFTFVNAELTEVAVGRSTP